MLVIETVALDSRQLNWVEKLDAAGCARLAAYCLQSHIQYNPANAALANQRAALTLNYWWRKGSIDQIYFRGLYVGNPLRKRPCSVTLVNVLWSQLAAWSPAQTRWQRDLFIAHIQLPKLCAAPPLKTQYLAVLKSLISFAKSKRCQTISLQLGNPNLIKLVKQLKFVAISPEGTGIPATYQLPLN